MSEGDQIDSSIPNGGNSSLLPVNGDGGSPLQDPDKVENGDGYPALDF